eukprot:GFUD01014689.1.p1 GENE.GFUD01014689.1~~GFUD01014689.1.p1  ORF type:complete len:449 (-),score=114.00 GFUD01014689.1:258-1583(-)
MVQHLKKEAVKEKVKVKYQPQKANFATRAILGLVILLFTLALYEYDFKLLFIECSQYALFLLSAHLLHVWYWKKKAQMDLDTREQLIVFFIVLPLVLVNLPFAGLVEHDRVVFITKWALLSICFFLVRYLKIMRNGSENELLLKNTRYHIGPGLAQANYRFLENVIKGKKNTGGHVQLMTEYKKSECLPGNLTDWFCPKVLILFPEWKKENRERIWGSVSDIFKKEKENGSKHTLSNEKITYEFKASGGNNRRCELEVLKNQDEEGNWYAVFAENRPLNTLYRMVGEPVIPFSEEDFNRQFHIYMRDLKNLLDEDEGCRGKYEIFHYKDSGKLNFSKEIIKQMKHIRNEAADEQEIADMQPRISVRNDSSSQPMTEFIDDKSEITTDAKDEILAEDKVVTDSATVVENVFHSRKAVQVVETVKAEKSDKQDTNPVADKKNV